MKKNQSKTNSGNNTNTNSNSTGNSVSGGISAQILTQQTQILECLEKLDSILANQIRFEKLILSRVAVLAAGENSAESVADQSSLNA
ncbi:MAG TPA: hypothetical protein VIH99_04675 [Bdellovibrionota bacterium]|jgi:hypothetical protein